MAIPEEFFHLPVSSRTLMLSHLKRLPNLRTISEARAFMGALDMEILLVNPIRRT